jgi:hypothetical protein
MGLARGLPISALKAAEAARNKRDPLGGSKMDYHLKYAHRQAKLLREAIERRQTKLLERGGIVTEEVSQ